MDQNSYWLFKDQQDSQNHYYIDNLEALFEYHTVKPTNGRNFK